MTHEVFTDLNFADDDSTMAEMLVIIMHKESYQLGLEINWNKIKIQAPESFQGSPSMVL